MKAAEVTTTGYSRSRMRLGGGGGGGGGGGLIAQLHAAEGSGIEARSADESEQSTE